jgi:drug/metabolite transporter (DMT)-like permease
LLFAWGLLRSRGEGFAPVDRKKLMLRGILGALSISCFFFGIKHTSLTKATLLTYTFPLFGTIFTSLCYREHPHRSFWPLFLLAAAGIILIIKPDNGRFIPADLIPLAGGIFAGGAVTVVRRLGMTDKPETVFASFMLCALLLSAPWAVTGLHTRPPLGWGWMLGMILTTSVAQVQMSRAYHSLKVSQGSMIQLLTVPFSALFAIVFTGEKNSPAVLAGGLIVITAIALTIFFGRQRSSAGTLPVNTE